MRDGGPADNSDAGPKNTFVVKSYKSKGSRAQLVDRYSGLATVTKGHPANRTNGNYKKGAPSPYPFDPLP